MPKDFYAFLGLIAALMALRLLNLPRGIHFFFFSLIVVGQVALLAHGFLRTRRRRP
ncbi:MAG: hypothetical protein GX161_08145 [Firmicutes bacterium]|jgi:hypothetical protein|nr:hypothetical protein [Bacillota bacterium]